MTHQIPGHWATLANWELFHSWFMCSQHMAPRNIKYILIFKLL